MKGIKAGVFSGLVIAFLVSQAAGSTPAFEGTSQSPGDEPISMSHCVMGSWECFDPGGSGYDYSTSSCFSTCGTSMTSFQAASLCNANCVTACQNTSLGQCSH